MRTALEIMVSALPTDKFGGEDSMENVAAFIEFNSGIDVAVLIEKAIKEAMSEAIRECERKARVVSVPPNIYSANPISNLASNKRCCIIDSQSILSFINEVK